MNLIGRLWLSALSQNILQLQVSTYRRTGQVLRPQLDSLGASFMIAGSQCSTALPSLMRHVSNQAVL